MLSRLVSGGVLGRQSLARSRGGPRRQPVERLAIPAATGKWLRRSGEGTT